jgi:hypothetical protein
MDKVREKNLSTIGTFTLAISFLCASNAFTAIIPDSWRSDKNRADYNNTLLVASFNGKDTDRACNELNHYLLADKGIEDVNVTKCIRGFSYIDHSPITPHNLTICDVGNGEAIPKKLRRADVLVLVHGGDEKEENEDRENFDNLPILHKRLKSQMLKKPLLVILNLDTIGHASVSYEDECEMESKLHADKRVKSGFLEDLDINRNVWVRYRGKRIGDRVNDDEEL